MENNREELTKELTALVAKAGMCAEGILLYTAAEDQASILVHNMGGTQMLMLIHAILQKIAEGVTTIDTANSVGEDLTLMWQDALTQSVINKAMH